MKLFIFTAVFLFSMIHAMASSSLIQETVQEVNESLFSKRELRLELLKNHPEAIPVLAEWEYQDWHPYDQSLTREKLIEGFSHSLNDDRLPLTFVVLRGSDCVGVIALEDKPEPELSDLDDGNPWGGSFHIIPSERNQKLGEEMAKTLLILAKRLGYQKINFYTSKIQAVRWYVKRGAKIVGTRPFRGHEITIMEIGLG